jgi:hypothetical protein
MGRPAGLTASLPGVPPDRSIDEIDRGWPGTSATLARAHALDVAESIDLIHRWASVLRESVSFSLSCTQATGMRDMHV